MAKNSNVIALYIQSLLIRLKLNEKEFSEKIGVSKSAVYSWTRGLSKPSAQSLHKLARIGFENDIPWLLTFYDNNIEWGGVLIHV